MFTESNDEKALYDAESAESIDSDHDDAHTGGTA
jgi:hypothetical protein